MPRTWTINGRFLAQPVTGVQRYAREVVSALDALIAEEAPLTRDLEVELLMPAGTHNDLELRSIAARGAGPLHGHAWEQLVLPLHVRGGLLGLCNNAPLSAAKQIVCIHDTNTRDCPQSYSSAFRLLSRTLPPLLALRGARVTTVSEYSAGQLALHGVVRREKVVVVSNGHEHVGRWRPRHSERTRSVAGPNTIVLIGSSIPHKNAELILGMQRELAAAGLKLAVVGAADPRVFGGGRALESRSVTWLGRISDGELAALFGDCLCLAFPSLVEGFGLPIVEAMALGCPVVCSDQASMPEVGGDAALYADPSRPEAWLERFLQLRGDPALRAKIVSGGRRRAQRFSWPDSAARYLRLMASMDGIEAPPDQPGLQEPASCEQERS